MSTPFSPLRRKSPGPTCWSDQRGFFSGRGTCSNARTMPEHRCSAIYIRGRRYREIAALDKWDRARAATPNSSPRRAVARVLPRAQRGALANRATLTPAEQASRPRCRRRPGATGGLSSQRPAAGLRWRYCNGSISAPYRNSFARSSPGFSPPPSVAAPALPSRPMRGAEPAGRRRSSTCSRRRAAERNGRCPQGRPLP